jgi:hypothetical protein
MVKLCPYCGKTLTEQALACKHCGEWLEDISDYLIKKGSVYAYTDSIEAPTKSPDKINGQTRKENKINCVFCEFPKVLDEKEINDKEFICSGCGKKNIIAGGQIDDVLRNVPLGWGWVLLTAYFAFAIQTYMNTLDDVLQMIITFSLSIITLLFMYFSVRRLIIKERYLKKKFFGSIHNASVISGAVSTAGVIIFVFTLHFVYPYTGLQSDKKETNMKILYYKSKISEISAKQKEINDIISKPVENKSAAMSNINLLDTYINLNNEEKKYVDSIYQSIGESRFYTGMLDSKKKLREANNLINKIIAFKSMSAINLKHYYISGNENSYKTVQELNKEISELTKEYSSKFRDLVLEE